MATTRIKEMESKKQELDRAIWDLKAKIKALDKELDNPFLSQLPRP